jgi:hypothetical protein
MHLKLRSTLSLLALSVLVTDGAMAQAGGPSSASDAKAKFASDYNDGRFADVIADGELLNKFNVLDAAAQLIIGQAYYKKGDFAGCVKYTRENLSPSSNDLAAKLLARCQYDSAGALTVSEKVGPLVKEAKSLDQAGNYKAAMDRLDEADALKSTPDDKTVINQLRQFIVGNMQAQPDCATYVQKNVNAGLISIPLGGQGSTLLEVGLNTKGRVTQCLVVEGSSSERFDRASCDWVKDHWPSLERCQSHRPQP